MKCDRCDSAYINGVFCHEHGCENKGKIYDNDSSEWLDVYKCHICGYEYKEGDSCCDEYNEEGIEL